MSMAIYYSKIHTCSKVFQLSEEEKTVHRSVLWLPLVQGISCGPRIPGNSSLCEECCSCEWHCWKGKKTSWYRSTFKIITNWLIVMYCTFYYRDVTSWPSLLIQCKVRRPESTWSRSSSSTASWWQSSWRKNWKSAKATKITPKSLYFHSLCDISSMQIWNKVVFKWWV